MVVKTKKEPTNGVSQIVTPPAPIKLDIGCGPNPKDGFEGVDQYPFDGKVKHVLDIRKGLSKWKDGTVEEVHCSHFLEHLNAVERCHFLNELYRVMKPGAKAMIVVPHWASCRAYGDPTHAWPPISEFFWYYLDRVWRAGNAPHADKKVWADGYDCDFLATWGYSMHPSIVSRSQDFQQFAMQNYKESCMDTICTLTKSA